ncbi:hypothetical protein GCM10010215_43270 [Streptomyces virginiae]|uniref:Uncharacterized protein n=1 Tax=Streptomyces virginiae TaxID=1961 RepID=A0ABQ3NDX1_STRVG|nr:hypothetical protein GCM10010215_43270 [Streptomyces virginiae]GHI10938.1 hypothetical protein Scinn_04010 [Streptomyces virginiae]GLV95683.1 hypothetical protein Slala04_71360 [Streptomyces lavendulae subsp. lavendulae]
MDDEGGSTGVLRSRPTRAQWRAAMRGIHVRRAVRPGVPGRTALLTRCGRVAAALLRRW